MSNSNELQLLHDQDDFVSNENSSNGDAMQRYDKHSNSNEPMNHDDNNIREDEEEDDDEVNLLDSFIIPILKKQKHESPKQSQKPLQTLSNEDKPSSEVASDIEAKDKDNSPEENNVNVKETLDSFNVPIEKGEKDEPMNHDDNNINEDDKNNVLDSPITPILRNQKDESPKQSQKPSQTLSNNESNEHKSSSEVASIIQSNKIENLHSQQLSKTNPISSAKLIYIVLFLLFAYFAYSF